jgi:hypothetical protein
MIRLKKFLGQCFGWFALVFGVAAVSILLNLFRHSHEYRLAHEDGDGPVHWTAKAFFLALLPTLVLLLPVPLTAVFTTAWWKVKQRTVRARGWAIAASLLIALQAIPVGLLGYAIRTSRYASGSNGSNGANGSIGLLVMAAVFAVIGVVGVVAFAPRGSMSLPGGMAARLPRVAGDGTSGILDFVAPLVVIAGYWWCNFLWMRWAEGQHLPVRQGYFFWPMLLAAVWLEILVHECGHALVGCALGMRLRMFVVGPFQWRRDGGNWKFKFLLTKAFLGGGAAGLVPSDPRQSGADEMLMIAAGPLASLYLGMSMFGATFLVQGTRFEGWWEFLSLASTFGFLSFVANLIPVRPEALYSDGARIYQLLADGPMAAYHRVAL